VDNIAVEEQKDIILPDGVGLDSANLFSVNLVIGGDA
jgi:hypothetical protein